MKNFKLLTYVLILGPFLLLFSCSTGRVEREQTPSISIPDSASQKTQPSFARRGLTVNLAGYISPPEQMELCGEPVPLNDQQTEERFDKEFTIVVYNNSQVYLWLKRMHKQFPWIEKRLQLLSLPDDLKYLIVAETDLLPRTWLAKIGNGRSAGISFYATGDQQRDFEQAVDQVLMTLKDLHGQFPNWVLTMTAYQCGKGRLLDFIASQKTSNYYLLQLPQSTESYVFRIMAIKAVLSNPNRYGYNLPNDAGY